MLIYTQRLVMRPLTAGDLQSLFDIYGDPATNVYNPAGPFAHLEKAAEVLRIWLQHWADHGFGMWAIALKDAPDTVIGFGGLSYRMYGPDERLNLGYRFAVSAWGKGYATELCLEGLRYAFEELGHPDVYAVVRPQNAPSLRVLEKAGMEKTGTLNDVPGQPHSYVYTKINAPDV